MCTGLKLKFCKSFRKIVPVGFAPALVPPRGNNHIHKPRPYSLLTFSNHCFGFCWPQSGYFHWKLYIGFSNVRPLGPNFCSICSLDEQESGVKAEAMDFNELPGNRVSNNSIEDNNCEQLPSTSIDSGEE